VEAKTPDQQPLPMEEEPETDDQPVERAPMTADITSEQASMIEEAVTDLPDVPVSIAMSPADRPYALLGLVTSEAAEPDLTAGLDVLYATHRLVGDALNYGAAASISIIADGGSLIVGASEQGGASVALYQAGEAKIGHLNLQARKVAAAATDMPLDHPYEPGLSPAVECAFTSDRTRRLQAASGTDDMRVYSCGEHEVALAGSVAHPDDLAPAIAALVMAADEVLSMLPADGASRVFVECAGGGAVIASCSDTPTLVVTVTGAGGTMGAAYVQARDICRALEEG
jgi:hypothetical protein